MLSYLLYLSSLLNPGYLNQHLTAELTNEGDVVTGGLIVRMGPVTNLHVADVKVTSFDGTEALPLVSSKGSLATGFSRRPVVAVHYDR
jgi:hypothetical protein